MAGGIQATGTRHLRYTATPLRLMRHHLIYAPVYAVPASLYGYYSYGYPVGSREWVIERGW